MSRTMSHRLRYQFRFGRRQLLRHSCRCYCQFGWAQTSLQELCPQVKMIYCRLSALSLLVEFAQLLPNARISVVQPNRLPARASPPSITQTKKGNPMKFTSKTFTFALLTALLVSAMTGDSARARHHKKSEQQQLNSQTSMEIFPIQRGYDGAQFIVTKAGYLVSLPGLGIAPDATQIAAYRDEQNNIWYIDREGVPVKLTPEQVQWGMAQINQQASQQAAQQTQQPATTTVVQQTVNQGSSNGLNAVGTGLAVAGGMVAGAAISSSLYHNNYYGIPYGVPVYHNGGRYYYNGANGSKVYINNANNKYINQWNHQTSWPNNNYKHPTQLPANGHVNPGSIPNHGYNRPTQLPSHHHGSISGNGLAGPAHLPANHHGSISGHGFTANHSMHHTSHGAARFSGGAAHGAHGGGRRR